MQERVWRELLQSAEDEAQHAAQRLQHQRQQLLSLEHQHQQLSSFRQEYAVQASAPGTTLSLTRLMHLRAFVESLDRAVNQLTQEVSVQREAVARSQQHLAEKRARARALELLIAKRRKKQAQQADRREQSLLDELAQVRAYAGR